jgi:hypothetical protein
MPSPGQAASLSTLALGHVFGKSKMISDVTEGTVAMRAKVLESDLSRKALAFLFTLTLRKFFEAWLEVPPQPVRLPYFACSVPSASHCNPT